MNRLNSLAFRLLAGAGVWSVLGLVAGGLLLSEVFRASVERSFDARLMADLETLIGSAEPAVDGGLDVSQKFSDPRYDTAFSGWYWQIRDDPARRGDNPPMEDETSQSLWDQVLVVPEAETVQGVRVGYTTGPEGQQLRFIERDISFPDQRPDERGEPRPPRGYRFAVAADRGELETEIARFNATLAWSLGALGLGLVIATLIQVQVGLQPLRRVREALSAIRSGRAQRLEGDFPAEIAPLAGELNALLAHNAEVVGRARTHVGNLAHFLKTPLTVLTNEASAQKGPLAETVLKQALVMRRQVDHYLARARAAATAEVIGARTEIAQPIADIARTLERMYARRGIEFEVEVAAGLSFRGERQDFEELVGNLMENACKWARNIVRVRAYEETGRLKVVVEDDGPGLTEDERRRVLENRERLDESVPGSGLGLSIVRDIAGLYGGSLTLGDTELGGLAATLALPLAEP